ncbi:ferric reductase-like transmembrane domain-containing protein [Brunnivagina elsteri]|uniref:Iron reductase n=1 Tax=Brunnivagina elsteri CCALA 953 TaxID=987040 RepID=A0A2A2TNY7_9CYAN|nr:ferric reductase-like transmembrane domain-containing protein [Calothrix elsteri]PAX59848.1 iron reductase [Calothrix elsteri CCALA 953]
MRISIFEDKKALIFLFASIVSYITCLFLALFLQPAPFANFIGFLGLIVYLATIIPSIFKTVFPQIRSHTGLKWLLRHRRYTGIIAFVLASNHGLLMTIQMHIDFSNPYTYIHYFQGILMMFIMTLLAITSNDWSVKKFKKNWKNLHKLTYLIIFILPWHILDKMYRHWSYLTPLSVMLSLIFISLFIKRQKIEMTN